VLYDFIWEEKRLRIDCENFSADIDEKGNIQRIVFREKVFEPPLKYTLYEINGEIADVSDFSTEEGEVSFKLTTKESSGRLTISPGRELKFHFEPDEEHTVNNVSIVMPFPLETEFHFSEIYNLGRKIDRDMPINEHFSTRLGFNFFLANLKDMWILFTTKQTNLRDVNLRLSRYPEMFIASFVWNLTFPKLGEKVDAFISVFPSMDEATKYYEDWLEKRYGVIKLRNDPTLPEWIHNVKLVIYLVMIQSDWKIAHDCDDIINLVKELREIGCPKDTLIYIDGFQGAFDSTYPTYQPHLDIGGEEKFKEMIDTIHKNGFRVMPHFNAWGIDPYHPKIDEYLKYALKDEDGNPQGWQTGGKIWGTTLPRSRPLEFRPGKVPFHGPKGAKSFTFETVYVPGMCEALFTVGGLKVGDARVKFTIGRRSITTPPGWFKTHDEYDLPFPFLLKHGRNKVHVEVLGNVKPDWSESWYELRRCFVPVSVWSHPIVRADTSKPEWIKIFVDEVESVVRKYNIDVVHVDATEYEWNKQILDALKERLPGVPISGEGFFTMSALRLWTFSWMKQCRDYIYDMAGINDKPDWLKKPSKVGNFVRDYVYTWYGYESFVPGAKIIDIPPPRPSLSKEELWRILRNARKLNYIPSLRLNYRKYGLDEESKKAIQEIASW